jgi:hypothetical protein
VSVIAHLVGLKNEYSVVDVVNALRFSVDRNIGISLFLDFLVKTFAIWHNFSTNLSLTHLQIRRFYTVSYSERLGEIASIYLDMGLPLWCIG